MRLLLPLGLLLTACEPGKIDVGGPATDDDTAVSDSDTDPADTEDSDLPDTPFGTLGWRLWDEVESVVFVSFTLDEPTTVHVEYSFDDGVWESTPAYDLDAGDQELTLVGIPYGTDAQWRVVGADGTSQDGGLITTGTLSSQLPIGEVRTSAPDAWLAEGKYLLTSINSTPGGWTGGDYYTIIFDRDARIVWAHRTPDEHWTLYAQVALTGDHILWDEATYWSDFGYGDEGVVHRWYLDAEIEDIPTPGLHHAFFQMPPDGTTLLWGSKYHAADTEALVEQAAGDAEATVLWTCADDWPGADADCESNCVFYSEQRDSVFYSFYTNNSLVEIDYASGDTRWWAGEQRGGYGFDPADAQFYWQHGVTWTADETLLLSSTRQGNTMLREYTLDEDAGLLTQVWSFDSGSHANTNGDAWRLANGNTLHVVGSASNIIEVQPDGTKVWETDWGSSNLMGRGEFIEDLYGLVQPR